MGGRQPLQLRNRDLLRFTPMMVVASIKENYSEFARNIKKCKDFLCD
jgi:hypothetical protein